jgi:hypothetical protein
MAWRIPDGQLDRTHDWINDNDRVEFSRAFECGNLEEQKMAMALMCADPATSEAKIRRALSNPEMPARYGYTNEEPTLEDVFSIGSARTRANSAGAPQMGAH